jgi:thiol peroxidase
MMPERAAAVSFQGGPLTLLGPDLAVGDAAPAFSTVDGEFNAVTLDDFAGKTLLISAVPSLDTPVCAVQTRRFNDEVANLPDDVAVLTVSMDLPFAQGRFCEAEGVDKVKTVSDHVDRSFGLGYGVLIKELGLLTRSVFVVGKDGKVAYKQIVPEVTDEPDYDAALAAARAASA